MKFTEEGDYEGHEENEEEEIYVKGDLGDHVDCVV